MLTSSLEQTGLMYSALNILAKWSADNHIAYWQVQKRGLQQAAHAALRFSEHWCGILRPLTHSLEQCGHACMRVLQLGQLARVAALPPALQLGDAGGQRRSCAILRKPPCAALHCIPLQTRK